MFLIKLYIVFEYENTCLYFVSEWRIKNMDTLCDVFLGRSMWKSLQQSIELIREWGSPWKTQTFDYFVQIKLRMQAQRWMKKRILMCSLLKTFFASLIKLPKEWNFLSPNRYGEGYQFFQIEKTLKIGHFIKGRLKNRATQWQAWTIPPYPA